jgi:hypothetical protein
VLLTVVIGHTLAALDVFLQGWVHHDLLGDRVSGQLPNKLVLPSDLGIVVLGVQDVVVVLVSSAWSCVMTWVMVPDMAYGLLAKLRATMDR